MIVEATIAPVRRSMMVIDPSGFRFTTRSLICRCRWCASQNRPIYISIGIAPLFDDFIGVVSIAGVGRCVTSGIQTFLVTDDEHESLHRTGVPARSAEFEHLVGFPHNNTTTTPQRPQPNPNQKPITDHPTRRELNESEATQLDWAFHSLCLAAVQPISPQSTRANPG